MPVLSQRGIRPEVVRVSLLATAGMRRLDSRSQQAAADIDASVRRTLESSGMTVGRVETLSGGYEAIYAWVNINELLGYFTGTALSWTRGFALVEG